MSIVAHTHTQRWLPRRRTCIQQPHKQSAQDDITDQHRQPGALGPPRSTLQATSAPHNTLVIIAHPPDAAQRGRHRLALPLAVHAVAVQHEYV